MTWGATQVWVYEEADESSPSNLYVHHDIMLPAFPLALAWLDCHPARSDAPGNLAAVRLWESCWWSCGGSAPGRLFNASAPRMPTWCSVVAHQC